MPEKKEHSFYALIMILFSVFYDLLIFSKSCWLESDATPPHTHTVSRFLETAKLSSQEHIFHTQNNPESVVSNTSLSDSPVQACIFSDLSWGQLQIARDHPIAHAAAAKSLQLCPTLCDPIDGSPPSFPIPGILQARTLEWDAISFSNA